jgi:hypothetical protein
MRRLEVGSLMGCLINSVLYIPTVVTAGYWRISGRSETQVSSQNSDSKSGVLKLNLSTLNEKSLLLRSVFSRGVPGV